MPNIVKIDKIPLISNEIVSETDGAKNYKAEIVGAPCWYDKEANTWKDSEFIETLNPDRYYIRNARVCLEVAGDRIFICDRDTKERVCRELTALHEQDVGGTWQNTLVVNDKNANQITITHDERPAGFIVTKIIQNQRGRMQVIYRVFAGEGIKRVVTYRLRNQETPKQLRVSVRWVDTTVDTFHLGNKATFKVTRESLDAEGIDDFSLTNNMFSFSEGGTKESDTKIKEDLSDLFSNQELANVQAGIGTNGKLWITFWTMPHERNALEDHNLNFDATWTNERPYYDGYAYQKTIAGGSSYSSSDVWFHTATDVRWGTKNTLLASPFYNFSRGFFQWDISGIPNNATITNVYVRPNGLQWFLSTKTVLIYQTQPVLMSAEDKHINAGGVTTLNSNDFGNIGYNTYELNASSVSDMQSKLVSENWFAIQVKLAGENIAVPDITHIVSGNDSGGLACHLIVDYTVPASAGTEVGTSEVGTCEIG